MPCSRSTPSWTIAANVGASGGTGDALGKARAELHGNELPRSIQHPHLGYLHDHRPPLPGPCAVVVDYGPICPAKPVRPYTLVIAEAFKVMAGLIGEVESIFTPFPH